MKIFSQINIFTFVTLTLIGCYVAILTPEEVYWNATLPNTPMPKVLKDLVGPETKTDNYNFLSAIEERRASKLAGQELQILFYHYYSGTEEQIRNYKGVDLFYLERGLIKGRKLNFQFLQPIHMHLPLLRRKNDSLPLKSTRLTDILTHLSVKPGSLEANTLNETIRLCESPEAQNEQKYCATSLKSMIDHSISKLGNNIHALFTEVEKEAPLQTYTITEVKKIRGDTAVSCHQLLYVYPVFYCHNTGSVRLSMVSMVGEDGTKVKGVSVCHTDTKNWNPAHLSFQLLKAPRFDDFPCKFANNATLQITALIEPLQLFIWPLILYLRGPDPWKSIHTPFQINTLHFLHPLLIHIMEPMKKSEWEVEMIEEERESLKRLHSIHEKLRSLQSELLQVLDKRSKIAEEIKRERNEIQWLQKLHDALKYGGSDGSIPSTRKRQKKDGDDSV